jgi:uncharacterized protein (DUF1778 family)
MTKDVRTPVTLRLSAAERDLIASAASVNGETISNWMRRTLLAAARKVK